MTIIISINSASVAEKNGKDHYLMYTAGVGAMLLEEMDDWKCSVFSLMQLRDALEGKASFGSKGNGSIPSVVQMAVQLSACPNREIKRLRMEVDTRFISMVAKQLDELVRAFALKAFGK